MYKLVKLATLALAAVGATRVFESIQDYRTGRSIDQKIDTLQDTQSARVTQ